MNELSKYLVESILTEDKTDIKDVVVVYVGRFQPMHKGHYAVYEHLTKKFGKKNVYVGSSDKTDSQNSPFNFKEKQEIAKTMFGIPKNRFVNVKSPYAPKEVLKSYDPKTTAFVTVVGEKDKSRLSGKYFEKYDGEPTEGYDVRGYVYTVPILGKGVSGTEARNGLKLGSEDQRKDFFKNRVYGKYNEKIFRIINDKLNEGIEIPKEVIEDFLLNEVTYINPGAVDDGPVAWFPNLDVFREINTDRATRIGYDVVNMVLSKDLEDYYEHPIYPDGPVNANSFFPSGVMGAKTATNQVDIYNSNAYDKWLKHVTRKYALIGYELVNTTLSRNTQRDDRQSSGDTASANKDIQDEFEHSINEVVKKLHETIKIPVKVGDTILTGRFKNKKVVVKNIGKDDHGMPTINGKKVVNFRLMKEGKLVELAGTSVDCQRCDHSWEIEGDDPHPYLCHNCGFDNQTLEYDHDEWNKWKEKQGITEEIKGQERIDFYEKYYQNLSPSDFVVRKEEDGVKITLPSKSIKEFGGGNCEKRNPNETQQEYRQRCFGYNPLTPPPTMEQIREFVSDCEQRRENESFMEYCDRCWPYNPNVPHPISESLLSPSTKMKPYEKKLVASLSKFMQNKLGFSAKITIKKKNSKSLFGDLVLSPAAMSGKITLHYNPNQGWSETLKSLVHELIHAKQVVKGELKPTKDWKSVVWGGKEYPVRYLNKLVKDRDIKGYKNLPWEKEAYSGMNKYYKEFMNSKYWDNLVGEDPNLDYILSNLNEGLLTEKKWVFHDLPNGNVDEFKAKNLKQALDYIKRGYKLTKDQIFIGKNRKSIPRDILMKRKMPVLIPQKPSYSLFAHKEIEEVGIGTGQSGVRMGYPSKDDLKKRIKDVEDQRKKTDSNKEYQYKPINEGGAYGHMAHPFDTDINLTFGDLKDIVNRALEGNLDTTTEKLDGQALAISYRKDRGLIAARNKSHLKNAGQGALDITGVSDKFRGRGGLTDAYNFAMRDLSKAINSLSDRQKEKIFQNGKSFMNLEVIFPTSVNVIPYGEAFLVFHGTMQYDDDGTAIGENKEAARILAGMIKQVNQDVQDAYTIKGPPVVELPKRQDLSSKKGKYTKMISKLQKEFRLKDTDGVGEYHQAWWENYVDKKSPSTLDNKTKMGLVKRWAFNIKKFRLDKKNIPDEKVLEWAKTTEKENLKKIQKDNLMKFENIFLGLGAEVLQFTSSALAANPDDAIRDMKKRIDQTIKDVKKSGDPKKIEKLKLELKRLQSIGGEKRIVPIEGIVFQYKGKTMKLTGSFASVNQLLGIFFG